MRWETCKNNTVTVIE